ncbi:MAG: hypothetical protein ACJA01_000237 [Saprospiraceae bacterium]|jgi:hypothetical protein
MKRVSLIIISLLMIFCFMSGATAQDAETRTLGDFHGISVGSIVSAQLHKGSKNEVAIDVVGFELSDVTTEIEDGVLKVGMKHKKKKFNWASKNKVNVIITYTDDPDQIAVSSSADIIAKDVIKGNSLSLSVSSSGDMKVKVDVDKLIASVSSSGDLTIKGTANDATVSATSSADFEGSKLVVQDAELSASSSADITIHVERSPVARASSSADITYFGSPEKKDISKSGQADVEGR